MLVKEGNLVTNKKGTPVALVMECDECIMINRAYWNDRGIRNRVSEIVGGTRRHLKMPHTTYTELSEKLASRFI
jgi:hypothetical protein